MNNSEWIESIEKEFKDIEDSKAWNRVYQDIRNEGTYDYECSAARAPSNKNLNRYRDVLPYDTTRIVLQDTTSDYINASLVDVESIGRKYILSQGPLVHTTSHFWLMAWQQKSRGIVMLNKIMEKNQIKCHQYWPLGERVGDVTIEFPSVNLKVELLKEINHSHYIYRTFRLTNTSTNEAREILHFHYTTWPDFGVPQSPEAFFKFLNVVRDSQCLEKTYGPAIIHCSAGIGRSGTFCLVDSILIMLSKNQYSSSEGGKVLEVLLDMRKFRMGLIQTPDQLKFSYQAIIYGVRNLNCLNGQDASEESSSEDVSQEDPPPLPPPRTDSLTRSMIESSEISINDIPTDSDGDTDSASDAPELGDEDRISRGIYQRDSDDIPLINKPDQSETNNVEHNIDREADCETPAKRQRIAEEEDT